MNVSLHTAAPHVYFGNKTGGKKAVDPIARMIEEKVRRIYDATDPGAVHTTQAAQRAVKATVLPGMNPGRKPVNVGFDGVVREKSGAVHGGPFIRPSRPQITAEEGTAHALAPFDA